MVTLIVKNTRRTICPIAPLDGTHLPNLSGMIDPIVDRPTNPAPHRYVAVVDRSPMKRSYTDSATTVTDPPSQIGVPAQYSNEVNAPAKPPNAVRTQT